MLETYCEPGLYLSSSSEQLSRADAGLGGGARAASLSWSLPRFIYLKFLILKIICMSVCGFFACVSVVSALGV